MSEDFLKALSFRARAAGLLSSWEVDPLLRDRPDPALCVGLAGAWREAARLCVAAADLIDPQVKVGDDPLRDLFR